MLFLIPPIPSSPLFFLPARSCPFLLSSLQAHFQVLNKQGFSDIGVQHPASVAPREARGFVTLASARAVRKVELQVGRGAVLCHGREQWAAVLWADHCGGPPARQAEPLLCTSRLHKPPPGNLPRHAPHLPACSPASPPPLLPPQPGEIWIGEMIVTAHDRYWDLPAWELDDPTGVPIPRELADALLPRRPSTFMLDED